MLLRVTWPWRTEWGRCSATSPGIWRTAGPNFWDSRTSCRTSAQRKDTGWVTFTTCRGTSTSSWGPLKKPGVSSAEQRRPSGRREEQRRVPGWWWPTGTRPGCTIIRENEQRVGLVWQRSTAWWLSIHRRTSCTRRSALKKPGLWWSSAENRSFWQLITSREPSGCSRMWWSGRPATC